MPYNCIVSGCNFTTKTAKHVMFHSFPTEKKLKEAWILAIKRGKPISKHSKVCGKHFLPDDYCLNIIGDARKLRVGSIPSQHLPEKFEKVSKSVTATDRDIRYEMRSINKAPSDLPKKVCAEETTTPSDSDRPTEIEFTNEKPKARSDTDVLPKIVSVRSLCAEVTKPTCNSDKPTEIKLSDVNLNARSDTATSPVTASVQTFISLTRNQLKSVVLCTSSQLKYYTGFTSKQFRVFYTFITRHESFPPSVLTIKDQIFLTLYRLRHNLDYTFLAYEFDITRQMVAEIFVFWIQFIFQKLKGLDFWDLNNVRDGQYTAIMSCCEIPIERSSDPECQKTTFSASKNCNTLKFLVAVSEDGLFLFCSDAYGGSISDKQITKLSCFLEFLKEGDILLTEKGFEIGNLLEKKNIAVNIAPFKNQVCWNQKDVTLPKVFAMRRIIVARAIGLARTYSIMCAKIPILSLSIINQIIYICVFLCNFHTPVVA